MTQRQQVFISYCHQDESWKDRLRDALRTGDLEVWDDRNIQPGEPWFPSIQHAIDTSDAAVCLLTRRYLDSEFCQDKEVPALRERRASTGMPVIPILVEECPWREYSWLTPTQLFPPDGRTVAADYAGREDEFFTGIAERLLARLRPSGSAAVSWRQPLGVDIRRLPRSGATAFGRERLIDGLDNA